MSNSSFLPIGTWLASRQYRIIKHIGEGGFGKTYLVENRLGEKKVVKEFFISSMCTREASNEVTISIEENKTTFEQQREKFEQEALKIFSLNNQHIVKVSAVFDENNTIYYVVIYDMVAGLQFRLILDDHQSVVVHAGIAADDLPRV